MHLNFVRVFLDFSNDIYGLWRTFALYHLMRICSRLALGSKVLIGPLFLSHLDLSYNNLSGRIPSSTRLQSFDALNYIENPQLCGDPLPKHCIEEEHSNSTPIGKTEDQSENYSFYMGSGVGFAVGFWTVCGVLFFKRSWRHVYFSFLDDIKDWVYVTIMLKVNCFFGKAMRLPP